MKLLEFIFLFKRFFLTNIKDSGEEKIVNLHRKIMINKLCIKYLKKKELIEKLNFENLLNEYLSWNSITEILVNF